jgi:cytochrome P450 family 4
MLMRMARPWLSIKSLFNLTSLKTEVKAATAPIYDCIDDIMRTNQHHRVDLDGRCVSVIRQLMDTKQNLTDEEIAEELFILMYGSHETSALSLSAALMLLAMHKDIKQQVIDEIEAADLSENFTLTNDETQNFHLVEMVVKETMRLFPPVALTFRETTGEIQLEGLTIPENTVVVFTPLLVHRNEQVWGSDAKKFNPFRFEAENMAKIHPYAFVPFSFGKRMCIGYRYAMIFMKIFLVNFLRRYDVETDLTFDEVEVQITPATTFRQGYPIRITRRK